MSVELGRRDVLASILAALFLALFPWLRGSEQGQKVARDTADAMLRSNPNAEELQRMIDTITRCGGTPTHVFMNPQDWQALQDELGTGLTLADLECDDEAEAA